MRRSQHSTYLESTELETQSKPAWRETQVRSYTDLSVNGQVSLRSSSKCEMSDRLKKRVQTSKLSKRIANYALEHEIIQIPDSQPGAVFGIPNDTHSRESWNLMLNDMVEFARHNVPRGERPVLLPPLANNIQITPDIPERCHKHKGPQGNDSPWSAENISTNHAMNLGPNHPTIRRSRDGISTFVGCEEYDKVPRPLSTRKSELFLFNPNRTENSGNSASGSRMSSLPESLIPGVVGRSSYRCFAPVPDPKKTRTHDGVFRERPPPETLPVSSSKPIAYPNVLRAGKAPPFGNVEKVSQRTFDIVSRRESIDLSDVASAGQNQSGMLHQRMSEKSQITTNTGLSNQQVTKRNGQVEHCKPLDIISAERHNSISAARPSKTEAKEFASRESKFLSKNTTTAIDAKAPLNHIDPMLANLRTDNTVLTGTASATKNSKASTVENNRPEPVLKGSKLPHDHVDVKEIANNPWNDMLKRSSEAAQKHRQENRQENRRMSFNNLRRQPGSVNLYETRKTQTEPGYLPSYDRRKLNNVPENPVGTVRSATQTDAIGPARSRYETKPLPSVPATVPKTTSQPASTLAQVTASKLVATTQVSSLQPMPPPLPHDPHPLKCHPPSHSDVPVMSRPRPPTGATSKRFVDQDYIDPATSLSRARRERREKDRASQIAVNSGAIIVPAKASTATEWRNEMKQRQAQSQEKTMRRRFEVAGLA